MRGERLVAPVLDHLLVFVSSTIKECAAERAAIREVIRSINHEPVLFEHIGARPHPPRELYKARLEMSHIFVGVYKDTYGWIAPGMNISGIEDEFCIATKSGMDRLIYVCDTPAARDHRLVALIERAKNAGLTIAMYSSPEQLRELVRNDVTAVVSSHFVNQALVAQQSPKPSEVIESLIPNSKHRFRRRDVEARLLHTLDQSGRLLITGPLGGGKTVLLAQVAEDNDWIYVDGQGLGQLDLLARVASAIWDRLAQRPVTLTTEEAAIREIQSGWERLVDATIAIDGAGEPAALWGLPSKNQRLVLTSQDTFEVPSQRHFEIPPLTRDEIGAWVSALRGGRPEPGELASLVAQSEGNPLYLRFYAFGAELPADISLRELEIRAAQSLAPRAREITSYLALCNRPLSLGDLHSLVGSDEGAEAVAEHLSAASGLVKHTRGHVQLVHEHLRATLLDQLHQAPARLGFFACRLGGHFEASERYVAAFHVYSEGGERRHADRVLDRAAMEAALGGGGAPAIPIFRRQAERAREIGQLESEIDALLSLAFALRQTGARGQAANAMADARSAAEQQRSEAQLLRVSVMDVLLDLTSRPRADRIRDLAALRSAYSTTGNAFDVARIETLLTAEYIAAGDYSKAETLSRDALSYFRSAGDNYGIRITQVNLAAALSGIDGREQEAASIAQQLQQYLDPEEYPRERAVLCNLLTRRYRELGDTARAAEFALEAIQIGGQLKDQHVIAVNRTNLGNVRRDEGALDLALDEYRAADSAAVAGGRRDHEAAANELIASVYNERKEYETALHHAKYASTIAALVGDSILMARANEECAVALKGQRDVSGAVGAYSAALRALAASRLEEGFFVRLLGDALSLCATSARVDLKMQLLGDISRPSHFPYERSRNSDPLVVLPAALSLLATTVSADRILPVVALTMADLFAHVPPVVERRMILQLVESLLGSPAERSTTKGALGAVAAVLMAYSGKGLTLDDVVDLGERLAQASSRLYFKPHVDGASHWTVRLGIADGLVVSLIQLDDDPMSSVTTTILALLFASLEGLIRERLLDAERLPRREAIINVTSRKGIESHIGPELMTLGDMPKRFAVADSTDFTRSDQPPILVVCGDSFPIPWRPNEHALSDVHMLFGEVLRSLVSHFLARSIEPEVLFPKIARLMREIGYRGEAERVHPTVGVGA